MDNVLIITEHGSRIPDEVRERFSRSLDDSIIIPSLSYYLK